MKLEGAEAGMFDPQKHQSLQADLFAKVDSTAMPSEVVHYCASLNEDKFLHNGDGISQHARCNFHAPCGGVRKAHQHYSSVSQQTRGPCVLPSFAKEDAKQNKDVSSVTGSCGLLSMFKPYKRAHDAYLKYQRSLPFNTVVPEPPHTFHDYLAASLSYYLAKVFYILILVALSPVWVVVHIVLVVLDSRQRRVWRNYRRSWPHRSQSLVRPVKYTSDSSFPLENWHLRCEDGRQRWYYGSALRKAEEGNELGRAQACGFVDLESYHARLSEQGALGQNPKPDPELLSAKIQQRREFERYQLGLNKPSVRRPRESSEKAMQDGLAFLMRLQDPFSGHWPNGYGGCMFLTPGFIFTKFIVANGDLGRMFPPVKDHSHVPCGEGNQGDVQGVLGGQAEGPLMGEDILSCGTDGRTRDEAPCYCEEAKRLEFIRYLRNYQNDDGGWGQHIEGHSTMLGTVLNYISLRMMGVPAEDPSAASARRWIHAEGGAVYTPLWGKMWLCILGLFSYDGVSPLLPELILLPRWIPFSIQRMWCHSRIITLPFLYLFGLRWSASPHPLLDALKMELFVQPFASICWRRYRYEVCPKDLYTPVSSILKVASRVLDLYERRPISFLRRYALEKYWQHIAYDDESTHFICLGPVNKCLNMLVTWIREGENSARYQLHLQHINDYLFMSPYGMYMSGYNGSQLWDTSFVVQATCACKSEMLFPNEMTLAHHYVDISQIRDDPIEKDYFYRHRTKGAWTFSTRKQFWQVSDCTSEGLRAILLLRHIPFPTPRIFDAVDEILSLRNAGGDGGWASYEPKRAPRYCELLNCSEMFKDIMVECSYAECSSSCIHTLSLFREQFPYYRRSSVNTAISEGIAYVFSTQNPDGSFYGSWAICYTSAAWLVSSALRVSKEFPNIANHPHCRKLADFLMRHQNNDGGWGEDMNSCVRQEWVDSSDGSQVVNTAWAVMAIMNVSGEPYHTNSARRQRIISAVDRGIQLIMSRQLDSGDWNQERINGMFNGNNPIHYPGYKNSMTVWALGMYNTWKRTFKSAPTE
ncbi:unnamed protein product [Phytomonas sp. Hart1]|nr:unnamed protein product [Phytomonas sp. Hart1]|eukprot:CCW71206.1 unnamed protein product [Phytomonas sp. isolate Hart1]